MSHEAFAITEPYYLIVDLEATCSENLREVPRDEMEIIEIGAVLLDAASLSVSAEFQTFVKPVLHPHLTPFCRSLTSITQAQVDDAPGYAEALKAFRDWFYGYGASRFCSWGDYDKRQFELDCRRHGLGYPFPGPHLNIKRAFSEALGLSKKFGLGQALAQLGLSFAGTPHRGIDDARNMARIVSHLQRGEA